MLTEQILVLYPEYHKVYGPYVRKQDGRQIVILYDGMKRSARLLAKVLLEIKLGRRLLVGEEVDHIDDNKLNDDPDNLQILTKLENLNKHSETRKVVYPEVDCVWCKSTFVLRKNQRKSSAAGPFCSRSCSGQHNASVQYGKTLPIYGNRS